MSELAVITPSRGRPERLRELLAIISETAVGDVRVHVGLDDDDPSDYAGACAGQPGSNLVVAYRGKRRSLSAWTNHLAAQALAGADPPRYLASLGDDHRPRTMGWDRLLIEAVEALDGPGIAYGDDLYQREALCTAWVVSAEAVRMVGWMMLPACEHMYVDTATMTLGQASGRIAWVPDVVVEHLHPEAGKAAWDETYRATNNRARYAADKAAFDHWRYGGGLRADAARLSRLTHEMCVP